MAKNNNPGRILKGTKATATLKGASGVWTLDEAMQAHRANAWPQPNLFQPVANSLRLKGASPASYAIRSVPRPGSSTAGTISFWTKLGYSANDQHFFQSVDALGGSSSANRLYMAFSSDGTLYVYGLDGAANNTVYFVTSQLFRDYGSWYHIVVAIDSTQPTQANRFKLYANGVQVTAFSTATYPTQGAVIPFSLNATTFIGCNRGSSLSYAGEIAEFNYIDGYGLQPTLFGKFDTNNTWVPVPYTGSYGTNGFYLPFTNSTTSQTLGYDASLTGTTTYDVDQDPYRGSVALHLTGNGPAGGNNNVFADSSPNNLAVTRGGITTQGSFSPFPMQANTPYNPATHGASAYFGGSSNSDTLSIASNAITALPGDFTLEAWVYPTSVPNAYLGIAVATVTDGIWFGHLATGLGLRRYGTGDVIQSSTAPIPNVWTHVAVTRSGSTNRLFINGVLNTTVTDSTSYVQGALVIGSDGVPGTSTQRWPGYISNLRITKGAAIYTSAFTPTMRPFGTLTTNLITFSEDFNNSSIWNKSGTTTIASSAVAPDGNPSATLLAENAGGTVHYMDLYRVYTTGLAHTNSIYVKAAGRSHIMMRFYTDNSVFSGQIVGFNLVTGTVGYTSGSVSASIQNVGNDWYRLVTTVTTGASSTGYIGLYLSDVAVTTTASPSYSGNGTSGVYIWGAQLELASSATNYTPTPANFSTAPSLLLNFANAAVVDSAGANNITTVGAATITSASKYGSGALAFSGSTSNYFLTNPGNQFEPGSQDFTVEFWWYPISTGRQWFYHATTDYWFAVDYSSVSTNQKMGMWASSNGSSWNMINSDSGGNGICNSIVPQNQWNHIAYTRNNTTFRLFLNGKLDGIVSASGTIVDRSSQAKYIGTWAGAGGGAPAVNGSIDDFRFTKGVARYTSDFAPPARALPEVGGKSFVTTNINAGVVQRFTTTGSTSWTAPTDVTSVEVLVVGGGGSGGSNNAGGGGGGGVIYNNQYPVTPGQTYTVTVGAGGISQAGSGGTNSGYQGTLSQFGNLIATPGCGGYGGNGQRGQESGSGSGGGGCRGVGPGAGFPGQGFSGGANRVSPEGGGGGGAGGAGGTGPGNGGVGLQFGISGTPTYYAGGGGGGAEATANSPVAGAGGLGGGGAGGAVSGATYAAGWSSGSGQNGTANTGGGGGGESAGNGGFVTGAGGSGVVIVRYTTTAVGNSSDATSDNLVDSPTLYGHDTGAGGEVVGNYATLNPLVPNKNGSSYTFSNGNLTATNGTGWCIIPATIYTLGGKWYWEYTIHTSPYNLLGFVYDNWVGSETSVSHLGYYSPLAGYGYAGHSQSYYYNSTSTAYGALFGAGDIIGVALDMIAGTLTFYKNGASQGTITGIDTTKRFAPAISLYTSSASMNLGQRAWAYAPPVGYNALTTKNLPRPAVGSAAAAPNEYFDAVTWTGNGATQSINMPSGFTPDLVWIKNRSTTDSHRILDTVRGATKFLASNLTNSEATDATGLTAFTSTGFTLGSDTSYNFSGRNYVAWCWKANGAAVSNTSGTITSQVSANITSGFSIVSYTGTGVQATVGHGLPTAPSFIILKSRTNATRNWATYHSSFVPGEFIYLNSTGAKASDNSAWGPVTNTTFQLGNGVTPNSSWSESSNTFIAYCWTEVPGFSKIGNWTNNNSNDGTFVYLGFKPAFVMLKNTDNVETWYIIDAKRPGYNVAAGSGSFLVPDSSGAEGVAGANTATVDFVSNGFKIRTSNPASGEISFGTRNYVYMAFAEKPFGNVNGTAR